MKSRNLLLSLSLILALTVTPIGWAFADEADPTSSQSSNQKVVAIVGRTNLAQGMIVPLTLYRAGWTTAGFTTADRHTGTHTSQSDLYEQQIWVDGRSKMHQYDSTWLATCSKHLSSVKRAECYTLFYSTVRTTTYAESTHHFHTSGYVDNNFTTAHFYSYP